MNYRICMIGSETMLFPFLQFGFTTYTPDSEEALRGYLKDVIDQGYGIVYIEDSYCLQVKDILDKYRQSLVPIFIPIGEGEGEGSYYQRTVREMMENAIGMNVI